MDNLYGQLKQYGDVKTNEPLSKHTTFKIGGPARYFVVVSDTEKLVDFLRFLDGQGEKYFILGGGSNMLVRDEGYDGVVVQVRSSEFGVRSDVIEADAGCITATIAREAVAAGLTGFEWAVGVPGTIGGAVRGNAGASGGEMKDAVYEVDAYSSGDVVTYKNTECDFRYRHSRFKKSGEVVLRVRLKLHSGDAKAGMKKLLAVLKYRTETQPKGFASTGCIFKNFEIRNPKSEINSKFKNENLDTPNYFIVKGKIPAGWLVEKAGMKGAKVGKAEVSTVHGNFVVNTGGATAQDVLLLVEQIKERVYDRLGVEIEEEIQIV